MAIRSTESSFDDVKLYDWCYGRAPAGFVVIVGGLEVLQDGRNLVVMGDFNATSGRMLDARLFNVKDA